MPAWARSSCATSSSAAPISWAFAPPSRWGGTITLSAAVGILWASSTAAATPLTPGKNRLARSMQYPCSCASSISDNTRWRISASSGAIRGDRHEARVVGLIAELLQRGHERQILLSHDICDLGQLHYAGGHGFDYLAETFLPRLWDAGIPEESTRRLTVDNAREWLTIGG